MHLGTLVSLYKDISPDNTVSMMLLYVDDCYAQGERESDLEFIRDAFGERFGIKNVDPRYFLGCLMEIEQQTDGTSTLTVTQPDFVEEMIIEFGEYLTEEVVDVPFEPGKVLGVNEPGYDPTPEEQLKYKNMGALRLTGQLLWVARRAYNVLLFGVTQLCSVMSKPSKQMWDAGIRMVQWLRDNYKMGIRFHSNGDTMPNCFYDSSHGQYASDSKAHHGSICMFAGGPVGNESKKHDDVGDSTAMNEYMACYHAARRARWWYQLIHELDNVTRKRGVPTIFADMITVPIPLYGDNRTAVGQAKEKRVTPKSRHTLIKYHWIRDCVQSNHVIPMHVGTVDNLADPHSKAVSRPVWKMLHEKMSGYDDIFPYKARKCIQGHKRAPKL